MCIRDSFQISKRLREKYSNSVFLAKCFLFCVVCLFLFIIVCFCFLFFLFFFIFTIALLLQIKTVQLNMYAEDGQLHTSNTDLVSFEGRISVVVNLSNARYENNRIIANPSNHQGMLLGNTKHHFNFQPSRRRLSNALFVFYSLTSSPSHSFAHI